MAITQDYVDRADVIRVIIMTCITDYSFTPEALIKRINDIPAINIPRSEVVPHD